jgi:DNA-directed RNA polymerase subunit N (RpoN/RPB10)
MALLVPLVQKYCSCTDEFYNPTHLAKYQKEFEELRLSGMNNYQVLQKMGIKRLCCREALFNPATIFLNSSNVDRIRDEIGKVSIKNKDTDPILPKRKVPDLP